MNEVFYISLSMANIKKIFNADGISELILNKLTERSSVKKEIELYCYSLFNGKLDLSLSISESYNRDIKAWAASLKKSISRDVRKLFNYEILWEKGISHERIDNMEDFNIIMKKILEPKKGEVHKNINHENRFSRFIKKPDYPKPSKKNR